jgi:carboxylesterase 2
LSEYLQKKKYKVWRYVYSGVFDNISLFPNAGAFHTSEIPEVFGTYPVDNEIGPATPTQIALSVLMRNTWTSFAKNPEAGPGWPALGTKLNNVEIQNFGYKNKSTATLQSTNTVDRGCSIYDQIDKLAKIGY